MEEHHLSVPRTARYYTLGEPGPAVRQVWVVCHGYGQLAGRFVRHFEPIADASRLIVAPEGLSRFYLDSGMHERVGATWMTREDRLADIEDYLRYLDALHAAVFNAIDRASVQLTVLGFSQGVATAARWVARGRRTERLVAWGGVLPPELDLSGLHDVFAHTRLTTVYGKTDDYITPKIAAQEEGKLRAAKIPFDVRTFDGGHEVQAAALRAVAEG
jgi:predicted esterase